MVQYGAYWQDVYIFRLRHTLQGVRCVVRKLLTKMAV